MFRSRYRERSHILEVVVIRSTSCLNVIRSHKVHKVSGSPNFSGLTRTNTTCAKIMKRKLFDPLGMTESGVDLTPELRSQLSRAMMGTYHGRDFVAPTFDLATTPAGNVYSTALDQANG